MQTGSILNDRFELQELLSETPVGNVYVALDKLQEESGVDDPRLAVKVLAKTVSDNTSLANELCQVSIRQRRLQHRHTQQHQRMYAPLQHGVSHCEMQGILDQE